MNKETLLKFPCLFPLKIMGLTNQDLISEVTAIIAAHCSDFNPVRDIAIKPSTNGKYISITATIVAQSQKQLDKIYLSLNNHRLVKITL